MQATCTFGYKERQKIMPSTTPSTKMVLREVTCSITAYQEFLTNLHSGATDQKYTRNILKVNGFPFPLETIVIHYCKQISSYRTCLDYHTHTFRKVALILC